MFCYISRCEVVIGNPMWAFIGYLTGTFYSEIWDPKKYYLFNHIDPVLFESVHYKRWNLVFKKYRQGHNMRIVNADSFYAWAAN